MSSIRRLSEYGSPDWITLQGDQVKNERDGKFVSQFLLEESHPDDFPFDGD